MERPDLNVPEVTKSERKKSKPDLFQAAYSNPRFPYVSFVRKNSPTSFKKTLKSVECNSWEEPMDEEINCLNKKNH